MRLVASLLMMLLLPLIASADVYIKTEIKSSGFAGLGGTKGEVELWVSGMKQAEKTKIDYTSALLRSMTPKNKSHSITDVELGKIFTLHEKEKVYEERLLPDLRAALEESQAELSESYRSAEVEEGKQPVPKAKTGEETSVRTEVKTFDEMKKFAGIEAKRTKLKVFVTTVDEESGEEATFKVTYDAWIAPEFPARQELEAFGKAYSEAVGVAFTEKDANVAAALASAGMTADQLRDEARALEGYPVAYTVQVGSVLTDEQKMEMAQLQKEVKPKKKSGFGGIKSIGGLKDKVTDAVTGTVEDKLTEELAQAMFGAGVSSDADGDPVFFSVTTEVKKFKHETVKPKVFQIPYDYDKRGD